MKNHYFCKKTEVRPNASGLPMTPDGRVGSVGSPKTPCFSAPGPAPGSLVALRLGLGPRLGAMLGSRLGSSSGLRSRLTKLGENKVLWLDLVSFFTN